MRYRGNEQLSVGTLINCKCGKISRFRVFLTNKDRTVSKTVYRCHHVLKSFTKGENSYEQDDKMRYRDIGEGFKKPGLSKKLKDKRAELAKEKELYKEVDEEAKKLLDSLLEE